jgi:hypothetical protein
VATTWGYKDDTGGWQEADPFSDSSSADNAAAFPLETYKKAAGVAYEYSKKKLEDTRAQQEALNAQKQRYSESDEARDYQQAQQAYKY